MRRLLLPLVVAACPLFGQAPAARSFATCFSPDTVFVLRLDGPQLREQVLFQEFLDAKAVDGQPFFQKVQEATGVDLEKVTAAWIAPQQGKDRMVVVLKGTFDARTIEGQVLNIETMQVVQRQGVPLAVLLVNRNNPDKTSLAAVLDKETLVFGRPELVDGFLGALLGEGKGLPAPLAARAEAMRESKALVSFLLLKLPPDNARKNAWMKLFAHAEGEFSLAKGDVVLDVVLGLAKPEMREPATKLIEGFRDLYALLDKDLQRLDPVQSMLLSRVAVQPDPERLLVRVALAQEVVEQFLRPKLGLR